MDRQPLHHRVAQRLNNPSKILIILHKNGRVQSLCDISIQWPSKHTSRIWICVDMHMIWYFLNGSSGYTVHLEWLKICQIPVRTPGSTLTPLHRSGSCLSSSFHPSDPEESRGPGWVSPFGSDSGGWSTLVFKPWSYDDFESYNMAERRQPSRCGSWEPINCHRVNTEFNGCRLLAAFCVCVCGRGEAIS